jgi:hypothetical protein
MWQALENSKMNFLTENNSLVGIQTLKQAIIAQSLVRVSSVLHSALMLHPSTSTSPTWGPHPVYIPHFLPVQGGDLKSFILAFLSHKMSKQLPTND